jgi:excisionase family DNA binding protein
LHGRRACRTSPSTRPATGRSVAAPHRPSHRGGRRLLTQGTPVAPSRKAGTARRASNDQSKARRTGPALSVAHAGDYLDLSRHTIYRLIEAGELRAFTVAGHKALRIAQSDLDAYIERRAAAS